MEEENIKINGTLIWYYNICVRETWLMLHQICPDQDNEYLELGRLISEESYSNNKKAINLNNIIFDLVKTKGKNIIIGEIKKSSKFKESSMMQLLYYLYNLKQRGINSSGELLFPKEKRKITVELNDKAILKLKSQINDIRKLALLKVPPSAKKNKFCKNCAYKFFCWS